MMFPWLQRRSDTVLEMSHLVMGCSDVKTMALFRFGIEKTLFWRRSQSMTPFRRRFSSTEVPLQCRLEKPLSTPSALTIELLLVLLQG